MQKYLTILLVLVLIIPVSLLGGRRPQPVEHDKGFQHIVEQEDVSEKVEVKWWVLPLFAVDNKDNSIIDLENKDIELSMDNQKVEDFILYRRDFSVAESAAPDQKQAHAAAVKPLFKRNKIIFFLFDTILTSSESIRRAKQFAREIIADSTENNRFVIMTIDLEKGLEYHGGPLQDKERAFELIDKKIKQRLNRRSFSPGEFINQIVGNRSDTVRYTNREMQFFEEMAAKSLKARSIPFFRSFGTFYYNINSVKGNKFIYLFSEGVSKYQQSLERGNFYLNYMKFVAESLGKCGSVLFVINPALAQDTMRSSTLSGKNTLEYLALESGGKYLQGTKEFISKRIDNIHRAYYEIAFADPGQMTGNVHKIAVESKRKGVGIHTLGFVERSKPYAGMGEIEKEILVLNLISQNPLYETGIESMGCEVLKVSEKKGSVDYRIKIPENYRNKKIDLYKVTIDEKNSETKVEKEALFLKKKKHTIRFAAAEGLETDFLLLNAADGTALIHGPGIYGDILEIKSKGKALSDDPKFRKEMETYLKGAADYCVALKEEAFRCFCKEEIEEVYSGFRTRYRSYYGQTNNNLKNFGGDDSGDISSYSSFVNEEDAIARRTFRGNREKKFFKKYVYDYQLISRDGKVEEQRKLLSKSTTDMKPGHDNISELVFSFLTEKAIFGPLTLLAEGRQEQFQFRLLEYDEHNGRRFAVIEAVPKKQVGTSFVYGKLWVDTENYSVWKIELDPRSILGYESLLQIAGKLRARVSLNCEIEYDTVRGDIRFPTRIVISESYKGGPDIRKYRAGKAWERLRTIISYQDYRFFDVESSVEKTKIDRE